MKKTSLIIFICSLGLIHCSGSQTVKLGTKDGKFVPCPGSPNCVSSQSTDKSHYIDPLHYSGELAEAREKILSVIVDMDRSKIITAKENYIHAEFTSRLFRFVDDVELYFDDREKVIHVRSASRIGYSDLGVNRKRVERIRHGFKEMMK